MESNDIRQLQPTAVWQNFYNLCQVPHPSGKRKEVGEFVMNFGKALGLETLQDETGNVLIRKPASPGMEDHDGVILQAHLDMVPQKNNDTVFDFETDAIRAYIDGEWVTADGTTLGADNGIGVAAAMAVLADKSLKHPPLEAFFTVDEETGMFGAFGLQPNFLQGKILLNMDSEDEGELYIGCAGGVDGNITFRYFETEVPEGDVAVKITLTGLNGGHSGLNINLQRANANKLIFRFLKEAVSNYEARLASVDGGNMRNAIPREAVAVVTVPAEGLEDLMDLVHDYETLFLTEYAGVEKTLSFTAEQVALPSGLIPEEVQDDLINAITACPNGMMRYIQDMPDVVETSTNLSIVKSDGEQIYVATLTRSSVESRKEELASMIESVFTMAGAKVEFSGSYPGWQPNLQSRILNTMSKVYQDMYGVTPKIMTVHAGLECGILGRNYPEMDMISFGPTMRFPHSPDEKVNIPTVAKFWDFLVATLAAL
ncbi:MAG: aminoacyl-histidine dipeptidase [Paludibacteraceae bacterium]|nr:aminoacyl-histidine dipeptidase [Paludibacteraceae bacterium]MBO7258646.1 aminoacyl-histidine dipeptidase [Paludibacteraceae bacterium]